VHVEQRGDHSYWLALGAKLAGMGDLLRGQFGLGAESDPTLPGGLHAGAGALSDQAAFEFGQDTNHLPHSAAGGGLGVNMLRQRAKLDAAGAELVEHHDEIAQTPA
jgi:hypothetical protein